MRPKRDNVAVDREPDYHRIWGPTDEKQMSVQIQREALIT